MEATHEAARDGDVLAEARERRDRVAVSRGRAGVRIMSRRTSEESEHVRAREDGVLRVASRRAASGPLGGFGASERARGRVVCASGRLASRVGTSFRVVARQDVASRRGSNANPHAKGRRFAPQIEREPHTSARSKQRTRWCSPRRRRTPAAVARTPGRCPRPCPRSRRPPRGERAHGRVRSKVRRARTRRARRQVGRERGSVAR